MVYYYYNVTHELKVMSTYNMHMDSYSSLIYTSQTFFTIQPQCPYVGKQIKTLGTSRHYKKINNKPSHKKIKKIPLHVNYLKEARLRRPHNIQLQP